MTMRRQSGMAPLAPHALAGRNCVVPAADDDEKEAVGSGATGPACTRGGRIHAAPPTTRRRRRRLGAVPPAPHACRIRAVAAGF
ncbi:Os07g0290350 [Oryza sativa Japonica Group]|nr:Os07g0290350 [Oryza sativa Japonica Group]